MATRLEQLHVKIFLDGANLDDIRKAARGDGLVKGFTTNPSLMRQAGVKDYAAFAKAAIDAARGLPISFEVFSDTLQDMEREARIIHGWGGNTYVKIPITNTEGVSTGPIIRGLSADGVKLNVTALLTLDQVKRVADELSPATPSIVSVFAGRIADTGIDPVPVMAASAKALVAKPKAELLWASTRELLSIFHAEATGCHIVTVTAGILGKASLVGTNLGEYSLETVKMFHKDAKVAGYALA